MNVLVFTGSPRKTGESMQMLTLLLKQLEPVIGRLDLVDCYKTNVSPCIDCRNCWKKPGCPIDDVMQDIYPLIDSSDLIIITAPVYFHSLPGKMKILFDRLQPYWAGVLRGDKPEAPVRKGAILLAGGSKPFKNQFLGAELVAGGVLRDLSADIAGTVRFPDTDHAKSAEDEKTVNEIRELAKSLGGN